MKAVKVERTARGSGNHQYAFRRRQHYTPKGPSVPCLRVRGHGNIDPNQEVFVTWLSQNAFFVLLLVAFVAMHLFGHGSGGHGGHGGHGGRRRSSRNRDYTEPAHDHDEERRDGSVAHDNGNPPQPVASTRDSESQGRHRHGRVF